MAARYKLIWFVPPSHLESTRDAVFTAGAGWVGGYARCSWYALGEGSFYGTEGTSPTSGEPGREEHVAQYRVETVVDEAKLAEAVSALRRSHPFEEPSFDIYPLTDSPA